MEAKLEEGRNAYMVCDLFLVLAHGLEEQVSDAFQCRNYINKNGLHAHLAFGSSDQKSFLLYICMMSNTASGFLVVYILYLESSDGSFFFIDYYQHQRHTEVNCMEQSAGQENSTGGEPIGW